MNERKTIVYAGGFALPDRNASAQRVLGNAHLFRSLGYEVVLVGQLPDNAPEAEIEGFRCIGIHSPNHPYYKNDSGSVRAAIERVGVEKIRALIAYNYPARPLAQLIRYASKRSFSTVAECSEWYSWEGNSLRQNLRKQLETQWRIRVLARRTGNVICVSEWGRSLYAGLNTVLLPFVIDETEPKWAVAAWPRAEDRRRFVYAGNPGKGLIKDYLHVALAALADFARKGADFDFQVAGISKADVLAAFPRLAGDIKALGDRITFHGRLPHAQTLGLIKSADFSFFVRPDNRMSHFGFPTKLAEAFACGTPTITNPTSDIARYVRDGDTGILLDGPDAGSITAGLGKALALTDDEVAAMKARCAADNPFSPAKFAGPVAAFLEAVR